MKKIRLTLVLFYCCFTSFIQARAQQAIELADIKKILINDDQGGLGSYIRLRIEVVPEQGRWNSYEIHYEHPRWAENRSGHKLITTINPEDVALFLKRIAVIKPTLDWRVFGISAAALKAEVKAKHPIKMAGPNLVEYISDSAISKAVSFNQEIYATDDSPYAGITIVKTNNDSLKVESRAQNNCMLPWDINGKESYDIQISRFFLLAIGNEKDYPNRVRLQGAGLKEQICSYINDNYAAIPIAQYRWYSGYPENVKLLKRAFSISNLTIWQGIIISCLLRNDRMPANVFIKTDIDIANRPSIEKLIRYSDTVIRSLAANNVVFKYYLGQSDSQILFPFDSRSRSNATDYTVLSDMQKYLPLVKTIKQAKLVNFYIRSANGNSQWLILPDNKLILIAGRGYDIVGLKAQVDEQFGPNSGFANFYHDKYTLLNADGSMVKPATIIH